MIKLLITALLITSIYNLQYTDIDGNTKNFSELQGRKILIVNIATGSDKTGQLAELQQLYQQYHDSLEILGIPSNSFGSESESNNDIKQFCRSTYGITFRLGAKGEVKGSNMLPVYNWLTHQAENGLMNTTVAGDFQKYLIDKNGQLIGVYKPEVSPLDSTITNAITGNW